jgi:hypothetical protein
VSNRHCTTDIEINGYPEPAPLLINIQGDDEEEEDGGEEEGEGGGGEEDNADASLTGEEEGTRKRKRER